jgi:hypothetical protein
MAEPVVQKFMSSIPNSKAAVIIPLYGFWSDAPTEQMTAEVLQVALSRLKSKNHFLHLLFVSEWQRTPREIQNIINGYGQGGNAIHVEAKPFASYSEYIFEGLQYALESTDARFIMFYNPWIMIREDGVDQMLERTNRSDVGIVSGYELRSIIEAKDFDTHKIDLPKEDRDLNINFLCMTRQFSEIMTFDGEYKTHYFLSRDWWQSMYSRGFEVITSQFIPIYSFEVDWTLIEDIEWYEQDKKHFIEKWKFDPAINYGEK